MSEIQCNSISSSKNRKAAKKLHKSLDAIKQIIKDSVEMENVQTDKTAILKLVKRNLQKICLTKNKQEYHPLHDNRLSQQCQEVNTRMQIPEIFITQKNVVSNYDYDKSKTTKELLRKTILKKRKSFDEKERDYHIEIKQKIWRPW